MSEQLRWFNLPLLLFVMFVVCPVVGVAISRWISR